MYPPVVVLDPDDSSSLLHPCDAVASKSPYDTVGVDEGPIEIGDIARYKSGSSIVDPE
jgi:hypothetical protein